VSGLAAMPTGWQTQAVQSETALRKSAAVPLGMKDVTISVRHLASPRNQPCAVCNALFVPAEDSGSRVFSMKALEQDVVEALLCGGCYSKWSHGMTVTIRQPLPQV
jgi:hypothetical protein